MRAHLLVSLLLCYTALCGAASSPTPQHDPEDPCGCNGSPCLDGKCFCYYGLSGEHCEIPVRAGSGDISIEVVEPDVPVEERAVYYSSFTASSSFEVSVVNALNSQPTYIIRIPPGTTDTVVVSTTLTWTQFWGISPTRMTYWCGECEITDPSYAIDQYVEVKNYMENGYVQYAFSYLKLPATFTFVDGHCGCSSTDYITGFTMTPHIPDGRNFTLSVSLEAECSGRGTLMTMENGTRYCECESEDVYGDQCEFLFVHTFPTTVSLPRNTMLHAIEFLPRGSDFQMDILDYDVPSTFSDYLVKVFPRCRDTSCPCGVYSILDSQFYCTDGGFQFIFPDPIDSSGKIHIMPHPYGNPFSCTCNSPTAEGYDIVIRYKSLLDYPVSFTFNYTYTEPCPGNYLHAYNNGGIFEYGYCTCEGNRYSTDPNSCVVRCSFDECYTTFAYCCDLSVNSGDDTTPYTLAVPVTTVAKVLMEITETPLDPLSSVTVYVDKTIGCPDVNQILTHIACPGTFCNAALLDADQGQLRASYSAQGGDGFYYTYTEQSESCVWDNDAGDYVCEWPLAFVYTPFFDGYYAEICGAPTQTCNLENEFGVMVGAYVPAEDIECQAQVTIETGPLCFGCVAASGGVCTSTFVCECTVEETYGPGCDKLEGWWNRQDDSAPKKGGISTQSNTPVSQVGSAIVELVNFAPLVARLPDRTNLHTYLYVSPSNDLIGIEVTSAVLYGCPIVSMVDFSGGQSTECPEVETSSYLSTFSFRFVLVGEFVSAVPVEGEEDPARVASLPLSFNAAPMTGFERRTVHFTVNDTGLPTEVLEAKALVEAMDGGIGYARVGSWAYAVSKTFTVGDENPLLTFTVNAEEIDEPSVLRLTIAVESNSSLQYITQSSSPEVPIYVTVTIEDSLGRLASAAALVGIAVVLVTYVVLICCYPSAFKKFCIERLTWIERKDVSTEKEVEDEYDETKEDSAASGKESSSHEGSGSGSGSGSGHGSDSDSDDEEGDKDEKKKNEEKKLTAKEKALKKGQEKAEGGAASQTEKLFEEEDAAAGAGAGAGTAVTADGGGGLKGKALGAAKDRVDVDPVTVSEFFLSLAVELVTLFISLLRTFFNLSMLHQSFRLYVELPSIKTVELQMPEALRWLFSVTDFFDEIRNISKGASAWNCGGALQIATPLFILCALSAIGIIFAFDLLLLASISIFKLKKKFTFFQGRGGGVIFAAFRSFVVALLFYILQVIIVSVSSVVLAVTGSARTCSAFDYSVQRVAYILNIIIVVLGSLFFIMLFAGKPKRRFIHRIPVINFFSILIDSIIRILLTSLGIWTNSVVFAHDIPKKAATFDDDDEDEDNKHEATIEVVGRTRGMIWLVIPATFVMVKAAESFNSPPFLVFSKNVTVMSPAKMRAFKFFSNALVLGTLIAAAVAPSLTAIGVMALAHLPAFFGNLFFNTCGAGLQKKWMDELLARMPGSGSGSGSGDDEASTSSDAGDDEASA